MTTPSIEAVVAGSKGFALALLAPLTERVGTRPRVASDPSQALALCRSAGGLVVVEFLGEDSLRSIKDLVLQGNGLRIVAAVAEAHAGAEEPLRALGVELARWDGKPDAVLGAVSRQLAAAPDLAPPSAGASVPPPAAAKGPSPSPSRTPFPSRPSNAAPVPPRVSPAPAVPPPIPAAARAPMGPAPVVTPAARAEASQGGVLEAAASGLFDDLAEPDDFDVEVAVGPAAQPLGAPSFAAGGVWPTNVPSTVEASEALARGLAGLFDPPGTPLAGVAEVVASLSELERAVFEGEPHPVDVEPVRRAAVMRVRVGAALATAPAEGGAVDAGAVSAFLAEIDALLSDVNALAASAPAELQPALEAVRNSLVKEAIDFSEASHRGIPAAQPAAPAAPTRAARETRIVSMASEAEAELDAAQDERRRWMFVALGVSVLVAAAFHGYSLWSSRTGSANAPGMLGPLSKSVVVNESPSGVRMVHTPGGGAFAPDELSQLIEAEKAKGNTVREMAPGALMILPGTPRTAAQDASAVAPAPAGPAAPTDPR